MWGGSEEALQRLALSRPLEAADRHRRLRVQRRDSFGVIVLALAAEALPQWLAADCAFNQQQPNLVPEARGVLLERRDRRIDLVLPHARGVVDDDGDRLIGIPVTPVEVGEIGWTE